MDFFFDPKGIAVVGATPDPNQGGRNLVVNLTLGYKGPIYPVNPKYHEVLGLKCYPRVLDIDGPVDLALIFIPSQFVPNILEDCITKGVRGAIIESGGFAEVGPKGKALQDRCLEIARKANLRIWGPNCMGLMDTAKQYVFSFIAPDAWQGVMKPGHVSLIVQSGLLSGGFVTTLMGNKTIGLSKVCSIGNKSDVDETELLEYFLQDPETKVLAFYLESFVRGRRFLELATFSNKPIVVLKGGKSPLSAEASMSHTASLAGNETLINGVLKQAGIHQAEDFFEMIDIARTLEKDFYLPSPPNEKPRIAILSYSGASGIVTTDHMEKHGLTLARLSPRTQKRLEALSPDWMPIKNPVDYWPAMELNGPTLTYQHAIETLHEDPEVEGIIVHLFAGFGIWFLNMKEIMANIKRPRKPILFWLIGPEKGKEQTRLDLEEEGWPTFAEIHRTVRVMASLFEESKRKNRNPELHQWDTSDFPDLRELEIRADEKNEKILDEHESKKWLEALGLRVVKEVAIKEKEEAIEIAHKMGFPVVLKGRIEGKIHKTEAGLVKLNLQNVNQLRSAYDEMAALAPPPSSFLIQPMLKADIELMVGALRDPQFGPTVMLGLGGVWAEIYKDVVFSLAPLNPEKVFEMVSDLKGQALLKGYRGSKPVNMKILANWLMRLGWLVLKFEKIQEIDVNPLLIVDGEPVAVDATLIFR